MKSAAAPLTFFAFTALGQVTAAAVTVLVWSATSSLPLALIAGSCTGLGMAMFLELSLPWQILNVVCLPAAAAVLVTDLPSWTFAIMLGILTVIYAPAFWTRVPYYPTSRPAYAMVLAELPADRPFVFVDLGCGFGDLLLFLSQHRPNGRFVGVELGVLPFFAAWVRSIIFGRGRVKVRLASMWNVDLSAFDFVYAFLSPAPMERLWTKAKQEMVPGSLFVTNSFQAPVEAARREVVRDERESVLYFHPM
jgi:SAM-dependent methyltransferase